MTTNSSNTVQIPPQTLTSDDQYSIAYYEALDRIEFELRVRPPEYRDINHHNWDLFQLSPAEKTRRYYIHNVVTCFVVRAYAIFYHHICGGQDPDSSPEPSPSQRIDLTVGGCLVDTLHTLLSHRPAFKAKVMLMVYEDQSELMSNFIELADCLIPGEQE